MQGCVHWHVGTVVGDLLVDQLLKQSEMNGVFQELWVHLIECAVLGGGLQG